MRGKAGRLCGCNRRRGITPAYAGKSSCAGPGECPVPDHPRLCGEKFGGGQDFYPAAGSPPPMRGKDHDVSFFQKRPRITPAYAGKSFVLFEVRHITWDHPRLCGEKCGIC